jgi:hypothetical protein
MILTPVSVAGIIKSEKNLAIKYDITGFLIPYKARDKAEEKFEHPNIY